MPSFTELRESLLNHMRHAAEPLTAEQMSAETERNLELMAVARQRFLETMPQIRVAPPLMYDPWTLPQPPAWTPADIGRYFGGFDVAAPPRMHARPPAKEPTSTTTIGEAEAIDAEYAALVADLGIHSGAVDLETFKSLVPRAGLRIYHDEEVRQYLHGKYNVPVGDLSPAVLWGWRPLREIDRTPGTMIGFNGRIQRSAPAYTKPIPLPVLLTVKTVRDACPSAKFFVSDEMQAERIPDPFLLVEIAEHQFVIERWDEPAFRAKA